MLAKSVSAQEGFGAEIVTAQISAAQERRRIEVDKKIKSLVLVCKRALGQGECLSRAEVARRAGVSRSFVYQNERASKVLEDFYNCYPDGPPLVDGRPMREVRKWRTRALNAEKQAKRLRDDRSRLSVELSLNLGDSRARDQALGGRDVLDVVSELHELRQRLLGSERECEGLRRELAASRRLVAGMIGSDLK